MHVEMVCVAIIACVGPKKNGTRGDDAPHAALVHTAAHPRSE